jgi:hypothetical protein
MVLKKAWRKNFDLGFGPHRFACDKCSVIDAAETFARLLR